jgi:hypothetical protein
MKVQYPDAQSGRQLKQAACAIVPWRMSVSLLYNKITATTASLSTIRKDVGGMFAALRRDV